MQLVSSHNPRTLPTLRRYAPHYALLRAALRIGAQLSAGLKLGVAQGFDSGLMLDYVYQNQPTGRGWPGRLLDRSYLHQPGWRAVRARTDLLQRSLRHLLLARRERGLHTHILDVAAGPGRAHLELLAALDDSDMHLTCWDQDPNALDAGRLLAEAMGLSARVSYEGGDATDADELARITSQPDVVVVAGLYEGITDDAAVCRSLRAIRAILPRGGMLLFTTQVAHPQLALVANVLTRRNGEPWVMSVRSLARVERWAREAGFSSAGSELEPHGMFGVTQCMV